MGSLLLPELEELIFVAIGSDASTLAKCALVSRHWLHHSRKQFFATRSVNLDIGDHYSKLFNDLFESALRTKEKTGISPLTLGPHFRYLSISGLSLDAIVPDSSKPYYSAIPDQTIKNIVSQCPNLLSLTLRNFTWDDISATSIAHIRSLSNLVAIAFHEITFTSEQLTDTIERLQPSITSCELRINIPQLQDGATAAPSIPGIGTRVFRSSVQFTVVAKVRSSGRCDITDFLYSIPNLNVAKLFFWNSTRKAETVQHEVGLINRYCSTLTHLSIPLGRRYSGDPEHWRIELPLSLQPLSGLRSLGVGEIEPLSKTRRWPITSIEHSSLWLSHLLRTLPAPNQAFSTLGFRLEPAKYTNNKGLFYSYNLRNFNWKGVEDELMDNTKFPCTPFVEARFVSAYTGTKFEEAVTKEMEEMRAIMGRVQGAGKLKLVVGY